MERLRKLPKDFIFRINDKKEETTTVTIRLPKAMVQEIDALAKYFNKSRNEFVSRLIKDIVAEAKIELNGKEMSFSEAAEVAKKEQIKEG